LRYLVTGAAGFIGFHTSLRLCQLDHQVIGLDNLNDYYDLELKKARLDQLNCVNKFSFYELDLTDISGISKLFQRKQFNRVIHLAAQPGVRYSLKNPMLYADSNLIGHLSILEACKNESVEHLIYASSSSVYGLNTKIPFSTSDNVDHPISLYAATKKSNELMSHAYSHLYGIPTTGLRFFTVYGPWGRPDMALFTFTKAILEGKTININNSGNMYRDFTYIDDIVEGIIRIQDSVPKSKKFSDQVEKSPAYSSAPYRIYNIGNGQPVNLLDFVNLLEDYIGIKAKKKFLPMQPGDLSSTHADTEDLFQAVGYRPSVSLKSGIKKFIDWYKDYYGF